MASLAKYPLSPRALSRIARQRHTSTILQHRTTILATNPPIAACVQSKGIQAHRHYAAAPRALRDVPSEVKLTAPLYDSSKNESTNYMTSSVWDLMSLKDRVIVITGAAKGIGLALAFAVAEAGGKLAIVDAASEPDEPYTALKQLCSDVQYYRSDVTEYETLQATFSDIARHFGRIHGLITAAGVCPDQPFLDRDPKSVEKCLKINTLGTYFSAQLAARHMVSQPSRVDTADAGSIVMIASVAAHRASRDQYTSDYCMSKGGVLSLSRQLGVELAQHHIRVNCISPGYIATDLTTELVAQRPRLGEIFNNEPAMKRIGTRTDLKAASVFLLSNASSYMTSGELLITGGLHAGRVH